MVYQPRFTTGTKLSLIHIYFVNYTDEVQEITVQVCSGIHPEIWDTYTGAIEPAQVVEEKRDGKGTQYQIRMRLPKDYGVFLVTG